MKPIVAAAFILATLTACTPDEEKITRVVEQGLADCKRAEGEFAAINVIGGADEVLVATCDGAITDLKILDEFHASATVGPYTWLVGVENDTGVWVLTQVDWEALEEARRHLAGDEPPKDARQRAEAALAKAQAEMPESEWVRLKRLENLLALRETERANGATPTALGDAAQSVFDESLKYAAANENPALAASLRMMVAEYYTDYASKLNAAFDNIGGQDEWLESLIEQAKKDGNKEDLANYTKTLEEALAGRDEEIATMNATIADARKRACDQIAKLDTAALEGDVRKSATALKSGTDCSPEALAAPPAEAPAE